MDIACPHCNAAYRVPDALLLQRKPLRCAACGEAWVPELPAEAPPLPVAPILAAAVAQTAPQPDSPPAAPAPPAEAAAPMVNPPGAPRPASLPAEEEAAAPRPARGPATPPPLAEPKWPKGSGGRRAPRDNAALDDAEEEAEEALRPHRPRRRLSGVLLFLAWLLSLTLIGGTLTILFLFRADVADAWRPFLRVVDLIGS